METASLLLLAALATTGDQAGQQAKAQAELTGQVEWTMFLMQELESRKPAKATGKNGPYEVGLLLEIADTPLRVLKLAAEQHSPKPNDVLEMVFETVIDRKDNKDIPRLGHMLTLESGRLSIVVQERPLMFGKPIAPFSDYYSSQCIVDTSIERYGKRDLKRFKSQRLSEAQLKELKSKSSAWKGKFRVPNLPVRVSAHETKVGSVLSVDIDSALAAVKKAGAVVYGRAEGGSVALYAHKSFREKAIKAIRADAKKNGYRFRA